MSGPGGDGVRVIAHRGSSHAFTEHSLEAYLDAIDGGADGLECDVRLTADGHVVCVHDATVTRLTGARGRVSAMTLEQLRRLDWQSDSGGPLLLRDLFELVHEYDRRIEIAVETKHPTRFGARVEEAVCDLIDWFGWLEPSRPVPSRTDQSVDSPVTIMSFAVEALRRVRRRAPALPRVYLLDKTNPAATRTVLPGSAAACGISIELVHTEPAWVAAIREAGHPLAVWTVDTEDDIAAAIGAGASWLITNRPQAAREALRQLS